MVSFPMEAEIEKAIAAGKITAQAGQALNSLKPGSFCLHKSWGFGQIASLNFLLNQVTIDFKSKKGHTMQFQYAAESLQPIPENHIFARKVTDLLGVKASATDDAVGLVRSILESFGGRATQDQIAQALVPDVLSEAEFKRWWDNVKKALKKNGFFSLPSKKSDPIELRQSAVSQSDEILQVFSNARQLKDQVAAVEQILKNIDAFEKDPQQLAPVISAIESSALKNQRLHTSRSFELIMARDEICERLKDLSPGIGSLTLSQLLRDEEKRLIEVLSDIPAAKLKGVLSHIPSAFGEEWDKKALALMLRSNLRLTSELTRLLCDSGKTEELRKELDRWIREHSLSTEVLYWLCKEREGQFADLISAEVFGAILTALERDQFNEVKRGGKLHDLLLEDRELIVDLLAGTEFETVRDSMRKLLLTPVFEELNKRSLMGRIIRVYPEIQSMLTGDSGEKQEALVVSWASLEKRKAEYQDLITKKIPENTKEIAIARSYGDLRENFEFKAAKEMQRVLMRRKSEMEQQLSRARGTNFENPDTTQVSIGTVVELQNLADANRISYTILGAWDGVPEEHIISYLTAIGQALMGRKVGDQVDLPTEHGSEKVEIISIAACEQQVKA